MRFGIASFRRTDIGKHTLVLALRRRSFAYKRGVFPFTLERAALLLLQPLHQFRELQKIGHPDNGPPLPQGGLRIERCFVGPLRWHRANYLVVDLQEQPRTVPVVALADTGKLPPAERMERVRHTDKMRCRGRRACILS